MCVVPLVQARVTHRIHVGALENGVIARGEHCLPPLRVRGENKIVSLTPAEWKPDRTILYIRVIRVVLRVYRPRVERRTVSLVPKTTV